MVQPWARTLIPALFTQITSPRAPPTRSIANAIRVAASEREEEEKNKDDVDDEKEASLTFLGFDRYGPENAFASVLHDFRW